MSHPANDAYYDKLREDRGEWLDFHGSSENDVMIDEEGEFIYVCNEGSDCTELTHTHPKVHLPSHLQHGNTPF